MVNSWLLYKEVKFLIIILATFCEQLSVSFSREDLDTRQVRIRKSNDSIELQQET